MSPCSLLCLLLQLQNVYLDLIYYKLAEFSHWLPDMWTIIIGKDKRKPLECLSQVKQWIQSSSHSPETIAEISVTTIQDLKDWKM